MDWQKYQHKYKDELVHRALSEQDRAMAKDYEIKLRQIVVPELKSFDRCITCHVAIEDNRMKDMPNPLKAHPGDYLDTHDMNKVGCTSCHDGQGRAITLEDAHAKSLEKFWEKPLLKKPFTEATCIRCHADSLSQTPTYNLGRQLFQQKACFACHSSGDIGGVKGPALSDIGNAS
ncbi:MAG TPA: c-type cytochrome, partial [Candidatus Omnitrophota bacterium]|nr:c-type cytochrome [Candidatus Omnitrophota bacterium]